MAAKKIVTAILLSLLLSVFSSPQPNSAQDQQPPYRLSDTVPMSYGSNISSLVDFYGTVFFTANDGLGNSIWKSDGTAEGTVEVLPGVTTSGFYVYQDHVFFTATDGFMRTNGEPGNIELVQSVYVLPMSIAQLNGALYFLANTYDETGPLFAFYLSDGTQAGTHLIQSWRYSNQVGNFESQLAVIGDHLVFNCPFETGRSLCVSDGTPGGTGILKQIGPPELTWARDFTRVQDQLFFVSRSEAEGVELWVTDGTPENTHIVSDLYPGPDSASPNNLTVMEDGLYFTAITKMPGATQAELYLWKSDGSPAGTHQVTDIKNELLSSSEISTLTQVGNLLFFVVDQNILWRTDGTAEGTYRLASIGERSGNNHKLSSFQGKLYFDSYKDGQALWVSNGTVAGTEIVKEVVPMQFLATDQALFFAGDDGYNGKELWISDGATEGTHLVTNINAALTIRPPKAVIPAGDRIFMISDGSLEDPNYPGSPNNPRYRLWISDGTPLGTQLAPNPEVCSEVYFDPQFHAVVDGILYYPGADCAIWRTDGTAAGTWKVVGSYNTNYFPTRGATTLGQRLFFFMGTPYDWELWVIEGDPAQAHRLKTILPDYENADIYSVIAYHGQLYFLSYTTQDITLNQPRGNWKLWTSDGTEAGTKVIYQVGIPEPIPVNSREPSSFVIANDLLFFSAYHPEDGFVLYQSNGTQPGTKVVSAQPATGLTLPLTEAGGYLYVSNTIREGGYGSTGSDYRYRTGLYKTRGDGNGLMLVVQFPDLIAYWSNEIVEGTFFGSKLFLSFRNRLWMSDGTAAGTYPVGSQGEEGMSPRFLMPVGPRIFYSANSSKGTELWSSNGSPQGTSMVADLRVGQWEGEKSSSPANLTRLGDSLFFTANDGVHGIQLWVYDYSIRRIFLPVTMR